MLDVTEHCAPYGAIRRESEQLTLSQVARRLGLGELQRRSIIAKLRALADDEGLPLPLNPRSFKGQPQKHSLRIGAKSRWDADAFDSWYDNWRNPQPKRARAKSAPKRTGLHEALAQRAAKIARLPS